MHKNFDSIDIFFIVIISIYFITLFLFTTIFLIRYFEKDKGSYELTLEKTKKDNKVNKNKTKLRKILKSQNTSKVKIKSKLKNKSVVKANQNPKKIDNKSKKNNAKRSDKTKKSNKNNKRNYKNNISYVKNSSKKTKKNNGYNH